MCLCHDEYLDVVWREKRLSVPLASVTSAESVVDLLVAVVTGLQVCPPWLFPLLVMLH
jgi:hypothetical protein